MRLGTGIALYAKGGRDKLVLSASRSVASFPLWVEQLVAESTGKEGQGILPVVGDIELETESHASDRFFVALSSGGRGSEELASRLDALEETGEPVVRIHLDDGYGLGAARVARAAISAPNPGAGTAVSSLTDGASAEIITWPPTS